jgi:hypothetical protein
MFRPGFGGWGGWYPRGYLGAGIGYPYYGLLAYPYCGYGYGYGYGGCGGPFLPYY